MRGKRNRVSWQMIAFAALFLLAAGLGLYLGCHYIDGRLLESSQAAATDIALLITNNFHISDDEAAYMKSLTFNEMEGDPINLRLMNVGGGVALNAAISNIYLVCPLAVDEYRYCPDAETAAFFGISPDESLNGIWLLNGTFSPAGAFQEAQRDDIYRYTRLDEKQLWGFAHREAFGAFSTDAWGRFITGYAPVYTTQGSFLGLLGVDMDPDHYQASAQRMILLIVLLFACMVALMAAMFILFNVKYAEAREGKRQFTFYSNMSHEMRTPMNGILGAAALCENETDPAVLKSNVRLIQASGRHLLELINQTLDYQSGNAAPSAQAGMQASQAPPRAAAYPDLAGKRILLCEDHPINAEIVSKMIGKVGCSTVTAENGQLGLERFIASDVGFFDAILMDIRMPVMDGLEAARRIRALSRPDAKTVPIIALTANSYQEDRRASQEAGMNAHLTKPVEPQLLYQTLSQGISHTRQALDIRRIIQ